MNIVLYTLLPAIVICCQEGWVSFNGYCYYRKHVTMPMKSAEYYCKSLNAHMVSITSEAEKELVINMTSAGISQPLWLQTAIGAYRDSKNGAWKWYDGTPFNQNYMFFKGGPSDDGLCAYLISDYMVNKQKRGSSNPSDYWFNGRIGGFVAGLCSNLGMVTVCKKEDTTNRRTEKMCGSTWTTLGSSCYKKFSVPSIQINQANEYCKQQGGYLVSINTNEERSFVTRMTSLGTHKQVNWMTAIGCYRESPSHPWKWYDGKPFIQEPYFYKDQKDDDNCCSIFSDIGVPIGKAFQPKESDVLFHNIFNCFYKTKCTYPAYQFVCEKNACDLSVSTFSGSMCACNEGFIDIAETSLLEAVNYKKGEKCVPNQCHVMKDTTILFMIDSSDSITTKHWPKMLDFVESGADKLPTNFRVGFMKFSTRVSFSEFVEPGWTARDFKRAVPSKYDAGATDTPAALKEARKIFANVRSKNKIAVLITDGLPFADEYDGDEAALNATINAAKELRKAKIRLTVMGVGPKICDNAEQVKEWVRNPKKDFFLLSHNVESLKGTDMDRLLKMVCK